MKQKAQQKKDNPAGMDQRLAKRIVHGNKLIEKLQKEKNSAPYADSILESAGYNKMRILEAHISNYSDDRGIRASRINATDPATGRNALHYLAYMANTDMIQLLGATDQMRMNVLDARDRNCMHYAAIKGKSTLINTIFMLFKSNGGTLRRAKLDPDAKEQRRVPKELVDLEKLNADIEKKNLNAKQPKKSEMGGGAKSARSQEDEAYSADEDFDMEDGEEGEGNPAEEKKNAEGGNSNKVNGKSGGAGNGEEAELAVDPDCPEEQDNKVEENKTPEATEFGQSEKAFETRMMREMDHTDGFHIDGATFEPIERDENDPEKGGQPQVSMKGLANFRDFKGRTPLHVAAIWGNK